MITNYKIFDEYININLINDELQHILNNINKEFNIEIFHSVISSVQHIKLYSKTTSCIYNITIDKDFCYLFSDTNNLIQREKFNDYKLILNKIKIELIYTYLFGIFGIDFYGFNKNMTYDDFMKKFGRNRVKVFSFYCNLNALPTYIINNYKYLIDAKNFDLI